MADHKKEDAHHKIVVAAAVAEARTPTKDEIIKELYNQINARLAECGGLESNMGMTDEYWRLLTILRGVQASE